MEYSMPIVGYCGPLLEDNNPANDPLSPLSILTHSLAGTQA